MVCEKLGLEPMRRPGKSNGGGNGGGVVGGTIGGAEVVGAVMAPVGLGRVVLAEEREEKLEGRKTFPVR